MINQPREEPKKYHNKSIAQTLTNNHDYEKPVRPVDFEVNDDLDFMITGCILF